MRLSNYIQFKNINMLLFLELYFIYSCKDIIVKIAEAFTKLVCFKNKDWANIQQFVYYRISQVMQICLRNSRHYDTSPYRADLIEPWQMKIRRKKWGNANIKIVLDTETKMKNNALCRMILYRV